jgi:hypothetical protein
MASPRFHSGPSIGDGRLNKVSKGSAWTFALSETHGVGHRPREASAVSAAAQLAIKQDAIC